MTSAEIPDFWREADLLAQLSSIQLQRSLSSRPLNVNNASRSPLKCGTVLSMPQVSLNSCKSLFVTTKTANKKNFLNPAHGDMPTVKSIQARGRDNYDDKVEEIWITALSNACDSRNVYLPDSTTRPRRKSTSKLLSKVSG